MKSLITTSANQPISTLTNYLIIILANLLIITSTFAQSPQKMSYQAVVHDVNGELIKEQQVGLQISILQGSADGTPVYTETQTPTTNVNGLVSVEIGGQEGFDQIDWFVDTYFIKTEIDPTGGTSYTIIGTSQLLSVPYALHSKTAETVTNEASVFDFVFKELNNREAGGKVIDYDGNSYNTVKIDTLIWMVENLKVTHYSDGTAISIVTDDTEWKNLGENNTDKACCYYNNNLNGEKDICGALYTYAAATNGNNSGVNVQGVCPEGWHLPSDAEWTELVDYVTNDSHSGTEGTALKSTSGWNEDGNGTDNYGFSALPGGDRDYYTGKFYNVGDFGYWWSSTEVNNKAYIRSMRYNYDNSYVLRIDKYKSNGFSVRCVRD